METDNIQPTPQAASNDLQAKYDSLYQLVVYMLLLLVIVTGTLAFFLMRQSSTTGADLASYRLQTTNLFAQLKPNEPLMDDLFKKFQEFGRTNPDFAPILAKYGLATGAPIGAASTNRTLPPAPVKKK